jgi:hypothetical protein
VTRTTSRSSCTMAPLRYKHTGESFSVRLTYGPALRDAFDFSGIFCGVDVILGTQKVCGDEHRH